MIDPALIRNRARIPAFRRFSSERRNELIQNGFDLDRAIDLAERETDARARISLDVGIGEALRAKVMAIRDDTKGWRFFLVQSPPGKHA